MRFIELRQSSTSPLKYHLELKPEEVEKVQDLLMQVIERLKKDEEK